MGKQIDCGDRDRYTLCIARGDRGTDLFICIGHGGYDERAAQFTQVPQGSQIHFYSGHDTTLDTDEVQLILSKPLGAVIPPTKSIAGGSANIWNYRVKPFDLSNPRERNIPKVYEGAWTNMTMAPDCPHNDMLIMNKYSDVWKNPSAELTYLSDIFNLLPGYTRYHWCACRSISEQAWDSFRSYNQNR